MVLNTHLDHISEQARLEGARLIVARLAQVAAAGEPLVITGDFNCDPGSPPYRVFQEAGFEDTFQTTQPHDLRDTHTYHGFRGREYPLQPGRDERIDWILTRGLRTQDCEIARDGQPPVFPSDHYPVVADVRV
jgi:endonuclease/exonuclease/phosphatase family metal-dependent hydrolase